MTPTARNYTKQIIKREYDFTMFLCCWIGCCRREDKNQGDQRQDVQYLQGGHLKNEMIAFPLAMI
jgi:hypothetical protein